MPLLAEVLESKLLGEKLKALSGGKPSAPIKALYKFKPLKWAITRSYTNPVMEAGRLGLMEMSPTTRGIDAAATETIKNKLSHATAATIGAAGLAGMGAAYGYGKEEYRAAADRAHRFIEFRKSISPYTMTKEQQEVLTEGFLEGLFDRNQD